MSNGLKWQFEEPSLYTAGRAEELQKAIRDTGVVKESEDHLVDSFCIILVHTSRVDFDASKVRSESLKMLPRFLAKWSDLTPIQIWEYRRKYISYAVWNQWGKDFDIESGLFMTDEAELPEASLTDAQKAEAATPGTPLTLHEETSP